MALVKLGSVKKTDLVISGSVNLSTDVGSSVLPVANGGTGSGSFTNGQLLIGDTSGNTLTKATLTGTANQVVVTNGGGSITLSLPQSIATTSSPTFSSLTLTTPLSEANGGTGLTALGTGVSSALGTNVGTGGSFVTNGGALGTPSSGTVTNLTGTASININGTVGATTPAAGAFTAVTTTNDATINNLTVGHGGGNRALNTAFGQNALAGNVSGDDLVAVGVDAGRYQSDQSTLLTTCSNCVFIGDYSSQPNNTNNGIAIGIGANGLGSNTTVIGKSTVNTAVVYCATFKVGQTNLASFSTGSLTTNRTYTLPDATGTVVLGGGTCSGTSSGTNTGDQTSVSGNAGTATALQTARTIYGNSFDGTANLTQIIASTYGGTGNGFTKFSGPTTAERVKTLSDASDTVLELGGSYTPTGTWTSLTMVTPVLGTPTSGTLTNCTGLPISSGVSGLGTGVATALAVNTGSSGAFVVNGGALGTPSSGTVTNLTGTASININGTVGATTPAAGTFTDLTINGNTTIGDASGDTVTQNAAVTNIPNALTYVRTHVDSSAETLFSVRLDEDTSSSWSIVNGTANNATFAPKFQCVQSGTAVAANFTAQGTTDTGTSPVFLYVAQIGSSNVATRPCHVWRNLSTDIAQFTASYNFVLKGGSTSPTKDAAAADTVAIVGVDNGAGNRELQVQPESGGYFAFGNNQFRRVPTANQDVFDWTPTVNTTDATQTTLATIPITASRTYLIEARVAARRTGGASGTADDGASYVRRGTYTTKSGTVTLMGSVQTIGTDAEDQAAWDVTLSISTTNVLVRVTGAANNNVTWMGNIKVQSVAS